MGRPAASSRGADFSGMGGTNTLYLDEVVHTAHAEVTEEGTAAAAAWARVAQGELPAYIPVQFRADHPVHFPDPGYGIRQHLVWAGLSIRHR